MKRRTTNLLKLLCSAGLFSFVFYTLNNRNDIELTDFGLLKSCCSPFLNSDEGICGQKNCTWTCYNYLPMDNSEFGIKSLGNEAFFHETSGSSALNFRQACSVESLAHSNPHLNVNVLMITPNEVNTSSETISALLRHYPNVKFKAVELASYFLNSPLQDWYFCTDWVYGKHAVSHLSDALRFLTLFKFGGYYFDLDFIVMRSLEKIRDFTAAESDGAVASGVIHFDYDHPLRTAAVDEFKQTYKKDSWANNGPGVIQRSLFKYCNKSSIPQLFNDQTDSCQGFSLYRPSFFYPIHYSNWEQFFREQGTQESYQLIDKWIRHGVVGVHVWNKLSAERPISKNSTSLYVKLMQFYCPVIHSIAPDFF